MKPEDFIKLNYKPKSTDLVCLFRIEPNNTSIKKAAENVALESSIGTWTDIHEKSYVDKLAAKVFEIKRNFIKIAYPIELFEKSNMPNILSSVAGNIFGMKIVKNLRLEDIKFPKEIINSFKGPKYGIQGIRKFLKIKNRPLVGTIVKPKLGLNTKDHAEKAYESWRGGCDLVKDDENLSSQDFNKFEKRLSKTLEKADLAEEQTGEKKAYLVNVTAETKEMIKRAELVQEQGGKYVMIDIITAGFSALQTLRNENLKLAIHAHRAMHAAFTRNPKHGISMLTIAKISRIIGVDQLHIGTVIGKLEGNLKDISGINYELEEKQVLQTKLNLEQKWGDIKPVFSVSSGGLYPGHVPFLVKNLGKNLVIQMGGGIHGHPKGTFRGAIAARQAIEATMQKIPLERYSKTHLELKEALDFWKKKK